MANLYYAFWILFLAGLVESFRLPTRERCLNPILFAPSRGLNLVG